jgi:hypothetical protein
LLPATELGRAWINRLGAHFPMEIPVCQIKKIESGKNEDKSGVQG